MGVLLFLGFMAGIIFLLKFSTPKKKPNVLKSHEVDDIETILKTEVPFYTQLQSGAHRQIFVERVHQFLERVKFSSVGKANHNFSDEVLVAASAMIPLYAFPEWTYNNIREVIFKDTHFDEDFNTSDEHHILGMVGEGFMNGCMVLSLPALREGFDKKDGHNTAIHEFVHLIDKADGSIDGVPEYLIPKNMVEPWLRMVRNLIREIKQGDSRINPYAATDESELFAVISEYFFEKPELLRRDHPAMYQMLNEIFDHYQGNQLADPNAGFGVEG